MENRRVQAYRLLGIPVDSDREAVVRAYRRLARATHPDVSADAQAADRFTALTEAYRLASETARADRDRSEPRVRMPAERRGPDDIQVAPASMWADEPIISPTVPAASWRRPPIVAGPVHVRPIQRAGGGG